MSNQKPLVPENPYVIMTPGPTQVAENVLWARSVPFTNPDLDPDFYDYYKDTAALIGELIHTENPVYILSGEGILGLEAAVASLTEPGDRVLVIENGVFGKGFADFVTLYGGTPVLFSGDYQLPLDIAALSEFLEKDHDFKYATVVHSDTPSGLRNPVADIGPLLKQYGILSVVDSVTGTFAEELNVDEAKLDIVCGGSQKALSAPPGLTFVSVSKKASKAIHARKTPIASFYANLAVFENYYENQWFPYTPPISDIYGLRVALENLKAEGSSGTVKESVERHTQIAAYTRNRLEALGLTLYLKDGYSNTCTAFLVPEDLTAEDILNHTKEQYHVFLAGSFDVFAGKLIRVGHMGQNANETDIKIALDALEKTLKDLRG